MRAYSPSPSIREQSRLVRFLTWSLLTLSFLFLLSITAFAQGTLLNVSYDVARELYKDVNPAFLEHWKKQGGGELKINQSHGGSSAQALAVINGLEADVVTMNQSPDIDILVERGGLVAADWQKRFPNGAAPYTTTSIFIVRNGNPKGIKDWPDLARAGVQVIVPNPKVTGNGRYTYLAAWGYALKTLGSEAEARAFVTKLFANVPVLDGGGRGATTTFTQRDVGDVLVTFENEAYLIGQELGRDKFDIVYPSLSINAPAPVAVVDKVVDRRGSRKAAEAYLEFLFSPEAQRIVARHYYRPSDPAVRAENAERFPQIATFNVEDLLGGWANAHKMHFADGGIYDQIAVKR